MVNGICIVKIEKTFFENWQHCFHSSATSITTAGVKRKAFPFFIRLVKSVISNASEHKTTHFL